MPRSARRRPRTADRDRFDRRASRNRLVIIVMAVLLGLSLVAVPLTQALDASSDSSQDDAVSVDRTSPCGPTPADVPEVTSRVYDQPFEMTIDTSASYSAVLETTCGDIEIELDVAGAPMAVNNLVNLAEDGYYEGVAFHRVVPGFVVQVGDPAGTGCGQDDCTAEGFDDDAPTYPGYTFGDELVTATRLYEQVRDEQIDELVEAGELDEDEIDDEVRGLLPAGYPRGTVAMANAGPDTNGSQFFVAQGDPTMLPGPDFTVLGRVTAGMDVVDDIAAAETDELGRPVDEVVLRRVTIVTP